MQADTSRVEDAATLTDTSERRPRLYTMCALALMLSVFAVGALSWVRFYQQNGGPMGLFTQTDYPAIALASRMVSSGQGSQLYDLDAQLQGQQRLWAEGYLLLSRDESRDLEYPYPYMPYIAVLWSPFSGLSPLTGMALWDLLNLAAYAGGLWLLLASLPMPRLARLLILLGGITGLPFIINLEQGQSSGVVALSLGAGIALLRRGHELPAGLVLGLLVLKVQWMPLLVLVLLWKRRWRALAGMAATAAGLTLLVVTVMGVGWAPDYLHILGMAQRYAPELLLDPAYSHSLTGQLSVFFTSDVVRSVNLVATLLTLGLLMWLWREEWRAGSARWDGAMALTMLGAIFTNLQLNTHDLSLLVLPAALGTAYIYGANLSSNARLGWYSLLWLGYFTLSFPPGAVFAMPLRLTTLIIALMMVFQAVSMARRPIQGPFGATRLSPD